MRWLLVVTLAIASDASAEFVVLDPPIVRTCRAANTWDRVAACLAKHGPVKLLRQLKAVRLVAVTTPGSTVDATLLIYIQREGEWRIGGQMRSLDYRLLGFEQLTIGHHVGYRLDVGQVSPFTLVVDGVSPVQALLRTKQSVFCSGDSYECTPAITACEVLVRGNVVAAFHGALTIEDVAVRVSGDRGKAGDHCAAPPKVYLGWSQPHS